MLIPMYFLIGGYGQPGPGRSRAAVKFLLYNLLGGLIMLAAVIGLYVVTAGADSPFTSGTFDFRAIVDAVSTGELTMSGPVANALFLGFMFAFAVKAPLWPLHSWLPDAAVQSTPVTAVLMMAVVDKVGTFAMLRYCLQLFPTPHSTSRPGRDARGRQHRLRRTARDRPDRRHAADRVHLHLPLRFHRARRVRDDQSGAERFHALHGQPRFSTAALMLVAGFLVTRRGTRVIADYGGVQKVAPLLAGTFLIAGLATLSLPGLAPFVSEFLV